MRWRWTSSLLALVLLAGCSRGASVTVAAAEGGAAPIAATAVPTPDSGEDLLPAAVEIISLVNEMRAEAGVAPLTPSAELIGLAFERSQAMIERKYLSHTDPFDFTLPVQERLESEGVQGAVAENLMAVAVPLEDVPAAAVEAWLGSPTHRALLLDARYQYTGVGLRTDGTWWKITQILVETMP